MLAGSDIPGGKTYQQFTKLKPRPGIVLLNPYYYNRALYLWMYNP